MTAPAELGSGRMGHLDILQFDLRSLIRPGITQQLTLSSEYSPLTSSQTSPLQQHSFDYDIVVIGAGPGGYVAAIRASQLGAKVAVVEDKELGGTCLNVGCIPTKAVISSVALYQSMGHAEAFGLSAENVGYDIDGITGGARKVVKQLVGGVGLLFKKRGITRVKGIGSIKDAHTVEVASDGERRTVTGRNVIIATGSKPARPPIPGLDEFPKVWTSDDAVFADHVPERLVVVGAGAVGLEFAYIFNALGSAVTVVEMLPRILPAGDADASGELARALKKQGIDIRTGCTLSGAGAGKKKASVKLKSPDGEEDLPTDVILLAAGRVPLTENLNLDAVGIQTARGSIIVNDYFETTLPGVYAIGDVIGEPLLAHAASAEGEAAAENIMGGRRKVNYAAMPAAVYTHPEYAFVGYTESGAGEKYDDVAVGRFSFAANGRALGEREAQGFAKIVISRKHGEILGAHIVGPRASDLLAECATAIASELTIDELIHSVHAHPTMSEVVWEAAQDARERAIHRA